MPFKLNIYLGAFVTYCDPIFVSVCIFKCRGNECVCKHHFLMHRRFVWLLCFSFSKCL